MMTAARPRINIHKPEAQVMSIPRGPHFIVVFIIEAVKGNGPNTLLVCHYLSFCPLWRIGILDGTLVIKGRAMGE